MPHRVLNELSRRMPKAIVSLDDLAAGLKVTKLKAKRLAIKAHRAELAIWWAETSSVIMSPDEAARLGYELWSNDTPEPGPKDWLWVPTGTVPKLRADFEAALGSEPGEPDRMDQIAVMDDVHYADAPQIDRWLAHPGTTSPAAQTPDVRVGKRKRGRPKLFDDYGPNADAGYMEAKSVLITPRVNVQGSCPSWSPAIEVPNKPDCDLCGAGSKLSGLGFCLACCRFGLDHMLPKLKPGEMPKDTAPVDDDGLAGGTGPVKEAAAA